jgi:hypothetical protein
LKVVGPIAAAAGRKITQLRYILPLLHWEPTYNISVKDGKTLTLTTLIDVSCVPTEVYPKVTVVDKLQFVLNHIDGVGMDLRLQQQEEAESAEGYSGVASATMEMARPVAAMATAPQYKSRSRDAPQRDTVAYRVRLASTLEGAASKQLKVLRNVTLGPQTDLRLATDLVKFPCNVLGVAGLSDFGNTDKPALYDSRQWPVEEGIYIAHKVAKDHLQGLLPGRAHVVLNSNGEIIDKAYHMSFLPEVMDNLTGAKSAKIPLGLVDAMQLTETIVDIPTPEVVETDAGSVSLIRIRVEVRVENPANRQDIQVELWKRIYRTANDNVRYEGSTVINPPEGHHAVDPITGDNDIARISIPLTREGDGPNAVYTILKDVLNATGR